MTIDVVHDALNLATSMDKGHIRGWEPAAGYGRQRFWLTVSWRETPLLVAVQARPRTDKDGHARYTFTIVKRDITAWYRVRTKRVPDVANGYLFVPTNADEGDRVYDAKQAPIVLVRFDHLIGPGALPYQRVVSSPHNTFAACLDPEEAATGRWCLEIPAAGRVGGRNRRVRMTRRYGGVACIART